MNHEKKLEYFAEAIANEVEAKKHQARKQMAIEMDAAVSRAVAEAEAEAELYILSEKRIIQKADNKLISEAQAYARRALAVLREELIAQLVEDVKADIDSFAQSHEYEGYLINSIQVAIAHSNHSFAYVQLTARDLRLSRAIREATGLTPEPGDDSDIGGFRLLSANRGMVVDYSFKSSLASEVETLQI